MSTALQQNHTDPNIQAAKDAIQAEINGLQALITSIDESFSRAVEKVHAMKQKRTGRLIIAGIGKSGHVSRKIAATLASTGTPAYFVHPGEASHGDLGMITGDDVVLMLSNSGENAELNDLIAFTRRFSIPLIAMTSNAQSSLGRHADIVLELPKSPEACPNGMAPTTSTTMMMAYGDALAVTLLGRMGLTKDQFKVFHPGGKLGQKLLKVGDIMQQGDALPLISASAKMDQALLLLSAKNMGCVLIVEEGSNILLGIITDGDLKRHMNPNLLSMRVDEIMTHDPKSIAKDALAVEALEHMTTRYKQSLTCLPVTQDGVLCGLIRVQDCLMAGVA